MTESEYRIKVIQLEKEIERNRKIRCVRVAAKFERMLKKLKEEYESQK